ncbi:hypothetical protein OAS31_02120 [Desulfobacterota bacterium]|mgnify:FL=1|jgi:hypothetical protein|nr:hypothetical protein [Thermodesulfobacteriota bacterium]MDG2006635.1 hypothetical protein [Thermodesulfobacteriota bacterium]MDG2446089.1 hypothetical protein [Thermodesulfobacteriota bacterium]NSX00341.1 hypothetical protein [bacterium]|tara:strand:+ start:382 stop:555 length:174 start_codon:yes stop_codon:yes gene_type:complete
MSIIKELIIQKLPPKAQEFLEKYKLEPNELEALPYVIGIFGFIVFLIGLISLSYVLY